MIDNLPSSLVPGENIALKPILRELEDYKNIDTDYCNSAYVVLWQDRGALPETGEPTTYFAMGAGDGRMLGNRTVRSDHNGDGKVSFADYETEIMGTFDLATNTWAGGVFDGRTFNVENGVYFMILSDSTGSLATQFGVDFNKDHLVSAGEECPIYFSAYKFFDDNNDRAFTPLYKERSHEVYLAGEAMIPLQPKEDLMVESSPTPLTAGCTPEKVREDDQNVPGCLTFKVMDVEGRSVDLSVGIPDFDGDSGIQPKDIHTFLFNDKPFEPLPQYYWIRTDLHNTDDGFDCNEKMFEKPGQVFDPIRIDFSDSINGVYKFFGFCANDEGVFEVRVYSPDRLHMGKSWVIVESPQIKYTVSGENLPFLGPDFIMTAGINRIYKVTAKAYDTQGQLITSGRLTPYTTKPASFDLSLHFKNSPPPYFLHLAIPGSIKTSDLKASQVFSIHGFGLDKGVYYNTTNVQYENNLFSRTAAIFSNPTMILASGWGYGCIYNYPREGVYMMADFDVDGMLTKEDSLKIPQDGEVSFLLFAEDVCHVGALVGTNDYSASAIFSDIAGKPPPFNDSPLTLRGRFRGAWNSETGYSLADRIFALDWDAFTNDFLTISYPQTTLYHSDEPEEIGKELLNSDNYDLLYGIANQINIQLDPADSRDMPIIDGSIRLQGNQSENYIYGNLKRERDMTKTSITFTPTGLGEGIANLLYNSDNYYFLKQPFIIEAPFQYSIDLHRLLDSAKALQIKILYEKIIPGFENELIVKITEKGTGACVSAAEVTVSFSGYEKKLLTDSNGQAIFHITPKKGDIITIKASKENYVEDKIFLNVGK
jgi:hypothetical protein